MKFENHNNIEHYLVLQNSSTKYTILVISLRFNSKIRQQNSKHSFVSIYLSDFVNKFKDEYYCYDLEIYCKVRVP